MTQPPQQPNDNHPNNHDNPFDQPDPQPYLGGGHEPDASAYPNYGAAQYGQTPYEAAPAANYGGYAGYPGGGEAMFGQGDVAAGPWRRLAAYLIDSILLGFILGLVLTPIMMPRMTPGMDQIQLAEEMRPFALGTVVLVYLYFTILHTTSFSTVGKRLLGIRVTTMDYQPISFGTSALRSLWVLVGIIPIIGNLLSFVLSVTIFVMLFTGDRTQGIHDKWAKTRGVKRSATNF